MSVVDFKDGKEIREGRHAKEIQTIADDIAKKLQNQESSPEEQSVEPNVINFRVGINGDKTFSIEGEKDNNITYYDVICALSTVDLVHFNQFISQALLTNKSAKEVIKRFSGLEELRLSLFDQYLGEFLTFVMSNCKEEDSILYRDLMDILTDKNDEDLDETNE